MKSILFLLLSISFAEGAHACSMSINQLYQKNLLVGYAASEMNVDLSKASSISISGYSQALSGEPTAGECPTVLQNQAQIILKYKPTLFNQCTVSLLVKKIEQIGGEMLNGPMIEIQTEAVAKSCSLIVVKPPMPHL